MCVLSVLAFLGLASCVTRVPPASDRPLEPGSTAIVGHVITVLTGPSNRWWSPELRFFEIVEKSNGQRTQVMLESDDAWFSVQVDPGDYEVVRLQISEGAFLATAGPTLAFTAKPHEITYVGTWRLGIETPQYDRAVLISAVAEPLDHVRANIRATDLSKREIALSLPTPNLTEARLYEVPPYPRIWWFRRHQTS